MSPEIIGLLALTLSGVGVVAGAAIAYGRLDGRVAGLEKRHDAFDGVVAVLNSKLDGLGRQLSEVLGQLKERDRHEGER